jgi:hypothetical protein
MAMNILNACLAFSLTMLILSTMAMAIVEFYYRFRGIREKYFERMIAAFFDESIWPRVEPLLGPGNSAVQVSEFQVNKLQVRRQFLVSMLSVSGLPSLDLKSGTADGDSSASKPIQFSASKKTERLSDFEFAQRFARTDCGIALINAGEATAKVLVRDLLRQLHTISKGATSDFRQRSRNCALIVAFGLALVLNVDAVHLLKSYSDDAALSLRATNPPGLTVTAFANHALLIEDSSIAVGWQHYPFCRQPIAGRSISPTAGLEARCVRVVHNGFSVFDMDFVGWLVGFVMAGFLIGLGSPFWFQVFQRLSLATVLVKDKGQGGKRASNQGQSEQQQAGPVTTKPSDPVEAYLDAATAQQIGALREED